MFFGDPEHEADTRQGEKQPFIGDEGGLLHALVDRTRWYLKHASFPNNTSPSLTPGKNRVSVVSINTFRSFEIMLPGSNARLALQGREISKTPSPTFG
jgi:hypothetical protein